jgi:L-ribulose-5-phosphate 3-epimerase
MPTLSRRHLLGASTLALASRLRAIPLAQFRLGVTTDEIDEDVLTAARFLREFGLCWAEVRNVWGKYNTAQPLDQIREARAIFDKNGVKVAVLGTGFFKVPLPPDTPEGRKALDDQWKLLDSAFERAAVFGTDKLRIFAFTYKGETPDAAAYPRIYELLGEAARRARAKKMRLAVENVGGSYVLTSDQCVAMLKAVREDSFGLTWDPNNAAHGEPKPFPDGYRKLDPARIFNVHLRDYRRGGNKAEWTAVGDGEFDNLGQIRALLKAGYRDGFTLETHYKHPQGKMMATRISLTALLKVVAQV